MRASPIRSILNWSYYLRFNDYVMIMNEFRSDRILSVFLFEKSKSPRIVYKYWNEILLGWIPWSYFFYGDSWYSNRNSHSISDAKSDGIKILTWFLVNPILETLIKIRHCVGSTYMRGRFLIKLSIVTILNCPVIWRCFWVNLRNSNPCWIPFSV